MDGSWGKRLIAKGTCGGHEAYSNSLTVSRAAREEKYLLMRESWRLESRSAQQSLMTARRKSSSEASRRVESTTPLVAMPKRTSVAMSLVRRIMARLVPAEALTRCLVMINSASFGALRRGVAPIDP